ncbi:hypothetical protein J6590_000182 [Homalodisca vitripennis]|nr:hypothetical protein J6590_000182 [Homalodisca vitripennis]
MVTGFSQPVVRSVTYSNVAKVCSYHESSGRNGMTALRGERESLSKSPSLRYYDFHSLHFTFRFVQRLKSEAVTELTPGVWSPRLPEEVKKVGGEEAQNELCIVSIPETSR